MRRAVFCLETGAWWRFDVDQEVRTRFSVTKVRSQDELSINLLELLARTSTAWAFLKADNRPRHSPDSILMGRDNPSAGCWVNKCKGVKVRLLRTTIVEKSRFLSSRESEHVQVMVLVELQSGAMRPKAIRQGQFREAVRYTVLPYDRSKDTVAHGLPTVATPTARHKDGTRCSENSQAATPTNTRRVTW